MLTTRKKVTTTVERDLRDGHVDRTQNVAETVERQTREFDDELGQVENKYVRVLPLILSLNVTQRSSW